jgi:hypothetical protein
VTTPIPNLGGMRPGYTGPRWLGWLGRFMVVGVAVKLIVDIFCDSEPEFYGPDGETYGVTPKGYAYPNHPNRDASRNA